MAHGLPVEALRAAWTRQNGKCGICRLALDPNLPREVHVDHCHDTELFRGFLCQRCNTGLGFFDDDPLRIDRAIEYLAGEEVGQAPRPEIYRKKQTYTLAQRLERERVAAAKEAAENAEMARVLGAVFEPIYGPDWRNIVD